MIEIECEQGSLEWIQARLGVATASQFARIVTKTGRLSAQREGYKAELLAEWVLQEPMGSLERAALDGAPGVTDWMERGKALEPEARRLYALVEDAEVSEVGFVYLNEDRLIGASPDGVVGEHGLLEIQCPSAPNHLLNMVRKGPPATKWAQIQGQIYVTGREWCDFVSYFPGLPHVVERFYADEKYQAALAEGLAAFAEEITLARAALEEQGVEAGMVL